VPAVERGPAGVRARIGSRPPWRPAAVSSPLLSEFDFIPLLALVVFVFAWPVRADTNEFLPELLDLPLWDYTINVRAATGYKDNLLLNRAATESSYLLSAALETMVLRLPLDGRQFTFFLSAEDVRYPQGDQVGKERMVLALAQGKLELGARLQGGLTAQYLYLDQVFDVSVTETNTEPLLLVGHQLALRPMLRGKLPQHGWVEVEALVQRQWFAAPVDDYWESGPKITLGRDYGHRSTVSLGYQFGWRVHDTRTPLELDGTPLPGEELEFHQHNVELALRHNWDERRRWRTVTRLTFQLNEDNGPGYFDYRLYKAAHQLRYVAPNWELKGQVRVSRYDFVNQPVSSADPARREKTLVAAGLRAERKVTKHLTLFADYEHEQSLSNRSTDEYRVHRVSAGVDWQF
jgi:hypothetical protein